MLLRPHIIYKFIYYEISKSITTIVVPLRLSWTVFNRPTAVVGSLPNWGECLYLNYIFLLVKQKATLAALGSVSPQYIEWKISNGKWSKKLPNEKILIFFYTFEWYKNVRLHNEKN